MGLVRNTSSNFFDIGHSNFFLDMSPEVRETKAKVSYLGYTKIKCNAQQRKQSIKLKDNLQNGKRYLKMTCIKGLASKIYKELIQLKTKKKNQKQKNKKTPKTNNLIKNGQKT